MSKKKSNKGKIIGGGLLIVGAGVAGYFLYREHKKAGGVWGIGLNNVNIRRDVKTQADRYALKADVYRALMGKNVTATSHAGFAPFAINGVVGVRR